MSLATQDLLRKSSLYTEAKKVVLQHPQPNIACIEHQLGIDRVQATTLFGAMLGDILDFNISTGDALVKAELRLPQRDARPLAQRLSIAQAWMQEAQCLVIVAGQGMIAHLDEQGGEPELTVHSTSASLAKHSSAWNDPAFTADAFHSRPHWAFAAYRSYLAHSRATKLNADVAVIKQWCDSRPQGAFIYTSLVDGRFQKAGFPLARVYERNGTIHRLQCAANCSDSREVIWPSFSVRSHAIAALGACLPEPPQCPYCNASLRPNCLLPHDQYWNTSRRNRQRNLLEDWLARSRSPLFILLGVQAHETRLHQFVARTRGRQCIHMYMDSEEENQFDGTSVMVPFDQALASLRSAMNREV
ncbi:hypothetical protein E9531_15595 [Lampropedia puyangensis]|uniref:Uncharacterized protein n=1 Tax=Lampropedia puyangensis TaxID=1330072 RepID=A0A4S8ES63_9BURK|nr:hypothetical protein [Lampropedia puyangensis]THT97719.1 hypothetical protein E9531_15595 [Lampropedia puyangensis]